MSKYSSRSVIRLFAVFFVVFFTLSVVNIQAQDAPTDTPTDVPSTVPTDVPTEPPTAVPTDVPTDIPTDVPTTVPTDVPTEPPTAVSTEAPTAETSETPVVASPTASETAAPTLPPEPAMTFLISESFDNGDVSSWAAAPGWALVQSENGLAWQVSNSNAPLSLAKGDFFNVAVQARFLLQAGSAQLIVRQSAAGNYTATIDATGAVGLYRAGVLLQSAQAAASASGAWRTLRLSAADGIMRVAVDGAEVIAVADSAQLPTGSVAIAGNFVIPTDGSAAPANTFLADDFSLSVKTTEIQLYLTPTPVPTEAATEAPTAETPVAVTPEASPEASETAVATIAPEPAMSVLLSDSFDSGDSSSWGAAAGWALVPSENGQAWQVSNSNEPLNLLKGDFFNVAVQAKFLVQGGSAALIVRQSAAGNYNATIDTSGIVSLYRAGALLQQTIVPAADSGAWRTLRFSAADGVLRVAVDGNDVITIADAEQLPPGTVAIAGNFDGGGAANNTFLVDDFALSVKTSEIQLYPISTTAPTEVATETATPAAASATEQPTATEAPTFVGKDTSAYPRPSAAMLALVPSLSNDDFANSEPIPSANPLVVYTETDNTTSATMETNETQPNCNSGLPIFGSVWFDFTPTFTADYLLSTATSNYDTIIGVYTGTAVDNLTKVACNDDATVNTFTSQLTVHMQAATTYHIQISGFNGRYGIYQFKVSQLGVPLPAAAPVLLTPGNGFITNNGSKPLPTFTWNPVAGSTLHYEIQIDNSSTFTAPLSQTAIILAGSPLTYTVSPNLPGGAGVIYYWRVRALNVNGGAGPWSVAPPRTFVVDTVAPPAPTLSAPAANAIVGVARPTFTWASVAGATGYQIDVDDSGCGFPSPELLNVAVANTPTTVNFVPAAPLPQGTYCWRVQSKDPVGNVSAESLTRSFSIFIGTAPANNLLITTATTANVTFNWGAVGTATGYNLILLDPTCTTPLGGYPLPVGLVLTTVVNGLGAGNYCWNVQAIPVDPGTPTTFRKFTISPAAAAAPGLLLPAAGALTNDSTPDFTWNDSASVDGAPFTYDIQFDNNGCTFPSPTAPVTGLGTSYTPGTALANGAFCWRVRTVNTYGVAGTFGAGRAFTVDTVAPPAPILSAPAANALLTSTRPTFTWASVTGATGYQIDVDNNGCGFPSPELLNVAVANTPTTVNFVPAAPLPQGTYCWRVQSKDPAGNASAESLTRSFSIFIGTAPANNLLITTATTANVTFNWVAVPTATDYNLVLLDPTCTTPLVGYPLPTGPVLTTTVNALGPGNYCWNVQAVGIDTGVPPISRKFTISPAAPAAPGLLLPAAGALTNDSTPDFTWSASASVDGTPFTYDIQFDNNGCTFPSPTVPVTGLGTSYTPGTALANGAFCWRVRTVNTYGVAGTFGVGRAFTIDTIAPPVPTLSAPAANAIVGVARPTFTWASVTGATGYQIDMDDSGCGFPSPELLNVAVANTPTTVNFVPAAPLPQGTYCWRVQSKDPAGNASAESLTRSFSIFIGTAPANNLLITTATTANVTFNWGGVGTATGYNLILLDPTCTTPLVGYPLPVGLVTTKVVNGLGAGNYCWNVQAIGVDPGTPTTFRKFTISPAAPAAPGMLLPAVNAALKDNTPDFTWNASVTAVGTPFTYNIQFDNNGCTFPSPTVPVTGLGTNYTPVTPFAEGANCWRVRTVNTFGVIGAWSAGRAFTIDTVAPAVPVLLLPANLSSTNVTVPKFTWNAATGATRYVFMYGTSNPPTNTVNVAASPTPSFTPTSPLLYSTYYWQVQAWDAAGNHSDSVIRSVKIISAPNAVPLLNRFTGAPITLSWGPISWAHHYQLMVANNTTFTNPVYNHTDLLAGTQSTDVSPLSAGTWYWQIRACKADNTCGSWSTRGTFTVDS